MLEIFNKVKECWDGKYRERLYTSHIVIHRIDPALGSCAEELAKAFRDGAPYAAGSYTGQQFPYHFVIFGDKDKPTYSRTEQTLTLLDTGVHALAWNVRAIGIAVSGNFHLGDVPTPGQWQAATNLAALLAWWIGAYSLYGHTELPHATSDALKRCPGAGFGMDEFRAAVAKRLTEVTPEYNKLSKCLMLSCTQTACQMIHFEGMKGGYGIQIDRGDLTIIPQVIA